MSRRLSNVAKAKHSAHRQWQAFKRSRPGQRFQDYYERQQAARKKGASSWGRPVRWILAAVAFAIGVVLTVFPGPAILFFAIAGGLIASDSRPMARTMDWCEVKLRAIVIPLHRKWKGLRPLAKAGIASVMGVSGAALSIAVWMKMKGG